MPTFRPSTRDKHKAKTIFCTSDCNMQMYIVKCMICEFSTPAKKHGHKNISPGMDSYIHVNLV